MLSLQILIYSKVLETPVRVRVRPFFWMQKQWQAFRATIDKTPVFCRLSWCQKCQIKFKERYASISNCCLVDIVDTWAFVSMVALHLSHKKNYYTTTPRSFLFKSTNEILQANTFPSITPCANFARIPCCGELTELIDAPALFSWELRKSFTYKKQSSPARFLGIGVEECIVVPWVKESLRIISRWSTISRYNRDDGCKSAPHLKEITYHKDHSYRQLYLVAPRSLLRCFSALDCPIANFHDKKKNTYKRATSINVQMIQIISAKYSCMLE